MVVEDHGSTWWHSGVLEGSSSVLTHHESGYNWAVLLNSRIIHNDLNDLMRYALHRNTQVSVRKWSVECVTAQKASIHQVTTMLATSKNVLSPGHNHLLTTGTDDLTLIIAQAPARVMIKVLDHQY